MSHVCCLLVLGNLMTLWDGLWEGVTVLAILQLHVVYACGQVCAYDPVLHSWNGSTAIFGMSGWDTCICFSNTASYASMHCHWM